MTQKNRVRDSYIRARSQAEKGDRKQKILSAAAALVLAGRMDDFTIGSLAQESGVAKGTIYLYFKTKTDVFGQLYMEHFAAWSDTVIEKCHGEMTETEFSDIFWSCTHSDELLIRLLSTPSSFAVISTADQYLAASRANLRIFDDVMHLVEDCLDLPEGAGSFLITSLFALMIGSAQMDMVAMKPALVGERACVAHLPTHKEIFLRNAPAIIAASRTYQPRPTAVAKPLELVN